VGALSQDIRQALRALANRPGFTLVMVVTLGLGIGANTAIFSMVNAVILQQLPFKDSGELIWIWSSRTDRDEAPFSIPDFIDLKEQNTSFERMIAFNDWPANLTGSGDAERLLGVRISADAFDMFGVNALIGRTLIPADDSPGSERVVVLTHGLWKRRFGGDENLLNKTLTLNGDSYTVVGVLPDSFMFPGSKAEMAIPLALHNDWRLSLRNANFLKIIGRVKKGVSSNLAQTDLDSICRNLRSLYPSTNATKQGVKLLALKDEIVGDFRLALTLLLGAVVLVLLIICFNLANLMLARASARRREIAIRLAVGATRAKLVRFLLVESMLLAIAGGALGLFMAWRGVDLLISLSPADLPRATEVSIDPAVLSFALGLSVITGLIFGLAPALHGSKADLIQDLKESGPVHSEGLRIGRAVRLLVVTEVAISLMLLIGAGLLVRSFIQLQAVKPGFDTRNLLIARLSLPKARYTDRQSVRNFHDNLQRALTGIPGVQSASAISITPLSDQILRTEFNVVGRPPLSREETPLAQYRIAGPDYFKTMGIPILSGRGFEELDTADTRWVIVINETLARRFWPGADPIGSHLKIEDLEEEFEIVGVVGDVKQSTLDGDATYDVYLPVTQFPEEDVAFLTNTMFWAVRTGGNPLTMAHTVRAEIQAVDKDIPPTIKTMDELIAASVAPRRFNLLLLEIFAGAALVLAAIGLYGLISYTVIQRTHEVGIRSALGAQPSHVVRMIMGQGLKLVLIGILLGLIGAFAFASIISSLLFGISPTDPNTFIAAALLLIGVGLLASYLPARRATKISPIIALRAM
jgi:putative ABC transport system permease protein